MNKSDVAVIDYGVGNLLSVRRGLEHCGAKVQVTSDPERIRTASRVVLPGVGAFTDGMAELSLNGLDEVVKEVANKGTPLLGICLGMQMLLDESEEFGVTKGLGLISGKVVPIPSITKEGNSQKIPHTGWNSLILPSETNTWDGTILEKIKPNDAVYFVHSFMASPTNQEDRLADCLYGGISVSASIIKDNIFGCQFHPEKSGEVGLKVLKTFLEQ
jgi:glutamine amidotransferase